MHCNTIGAVFLALCCGFSAAAELTLQQAIELALSDQPLLAAQNASIAAARQSAVADAQLPDPRAKIGLLGVPLDPFSLRRDDFTMLNLAYEQTIVRPQKRALRGRRGELQAEVAQAQLGDTTRAIRRDASLAWLALYHPLRAQATLREVSAFYRQQIDAGLIGLRAGKVPLHEIARLRTELELQADRLADISGQAAKARAELARWIGAEAAQRPLPAELAARTPFAPLAALRAGLAAHPQLSAAAKEIAAADNEIALARANFKGDWGVELSYQRRQDFDDLVSVQFSFDLPIAKANRQERALAGKFEERAQRVAMHRDHQRQLAAQLDSAYAEWDSARERGARYESTILPQAEERVKAVLAAYRGNRAELLQVIDARRAKTELSLQVLALRVTEARAAAQLDYLVEALRHE